MKSVMHLQGAQRGLPDRSHPHPVLPRSTCCLPSHTLRTPCSAFFCPPHPPTPLAFLGWLFLPGAKPGIGMVRTVLVQATSSLTAESSRMCCMARLQHSWDATRDLCWPKDWLGLWSSGQLQLIVMLPENVLLLVATHLASLVGGTCLYGIQWPGQFFTSCFFLL